MAGRRALIEAIDQEGVRRAEEILRKGGEEADTLMTRAREEIAARDAAAQGNLREELVRLRRRERNRALLEAGRRRALAEEQVLLALLAWVREHLNGLRKRAEYPEALRRMWGEALSATGIGRLARRAGEAEPVPGVVRLHPEDVPLLREEADRTGWRIIPDPAVSGGLRMDLRGGKIVIANTLESRLEKGWSGWLPEVRKILLE